MCSCTRGKERHLSENESISPKVGKQVLYMKIMSGIRRVLCQSHALHKALPSLQTSIKPAKGKDFSIFLRILFKTSKIFILFIFSFRKKDLLALVCKVHFDFFFFCVWISFKSCGICLIAGLFLLGRY